jgi:hypothetical protein
MLHSEATLYRCKNARLAGVDMPGRSLLAFADGSLICRILCQIASYEIEYIFKLSYIKHRM